MKRIRLSLTGVAEVVTEAAEKKLGKDNSVPRCDSGHTREFYEDLNIPEDRIPKELIEREKSQDQEVELDDEDFETVTSDIIVYADQIKLMVTDADFTTLFLHDGITLQVLETSEEIDYYLDYMERNQFEKIRDSIQAFFRRIKWKLKGYKKVDYKEILARPENQPDYIAPKTN